MVRASGLHPEGRGFESLFAHVFRTIALAAVMVVALVGCGDDSTPNSDVSGPTATNAILADAGLSGLDARQIIDKLDAMPVADRPEGLMASVQPDALTISDGQREVELPMPADEVYVSVAPYVDQTHECHFHSLTTCRGELSKADLKVTVTNADGDVVIDDEPRQTFDNGFVGLWLPRGATFKVTVEHDGRSGSRTISTRSSDDATCVTTLRLA